MSQYYFSFASSHSFFVSFLGIYARRRNLSKEEIIRDDQLWDRLEAHNDFIAERIRLLSATAWQDNHNTAKEYSIPNWNQQAWREFKDKNNFAGNVMVTFNNFYNKIHQDNGDLNPWTYGIFSYIEKPSGIPIPPPSNETGHGLVFTRHHSIIDFAHANGIVEVLWKTTQFVHKTNPPPPSLRTTDKHTHFGSSFQINKKLGNVGVKLKNASDEHVRKRTLCKDQRYPK